jgi:hypothetical protein
MIEIIIAFLVGLFSGAIAVYLLLKSTAKQAMAKWEKDIKEMGVKEYKEKIKNAE